MSETLKSKLYAERRNAWEQAKTTLEAAEAENRELTAEETGAFEKANEAIDSLDARIQTLLDHEKRAAKADEYAAELEQRGAKLDAADPADSELRSFLKGERRSMVVAPERPLSVQEYRDLSKLSAGAGANTVKTGFYEKLMAHLIEVSGIMSAGPTVLATQTGEQIQVPKTTSHSSGALIAEAGSITESDPAFGQVALDAYKYAMSVQVSTELVTDTSVDLLGYLAMQAGRAVGNAFGVHAITGTGSSQPNGVVTAATLGVTGSASVSGAFTADNLIDLYFSVIAPYRNSASCGWLMRDATLGAVRKLKDTTNQYIWQPSLQVGAPDTLLGKPVHTDPNVAAVALSAKSVVFGDFSQYFVRTVQGIRFERSDDFAFQNDLVTFRCIFRADGDLVDTTGAVKYFAGNAA